VPLDWSAIVATLAAHWIAQEREMRRCLATSFRPAMRRRKEKRNRQNLLVVERKREVLRVVEL
jgi:hypothetical protein